MPLFCYRSGKFSAILAHNPIRIMPGEAQESDAASPRVFATTHWSVVLAATLTALAGLALTSAVPAQTHTVLKSFGILTNMTGMEPYSQLVQGADGTLYGTASSGAGY